MFLYHCITIKTKKMKPILFLSIISAFILTSCCDEKNTNAAEQSANQTQLIDSTNNSEYLTYATLWYQKSAELQAIYYQNFNLAKLMLDKYIKENRLKLKKKPRAIITDIDETVLDNSPYNANLILKGTSYNKETWNAWVNEKRAKALPGALEFLKYAQEKGIEIFYISNRNTNEIDPTIENLKNEHFPFADKEHMFFKTETSDKSIRRNKIAETHEIILLLGDNLRDFDEIFGNRGNDAGFNVTAENKNKFGSVFIVFPNPMYGEWEKHIYKGNFDKSDAEKKESRRQMLTK